MKVDDVKSNSNMPLSNMKLLYKKSTIEMESGFQNIVGLVTCKNGPRRESLTNIPTMERQQCRNIFSTTIRTA